MSKLAGTSNDLTGLARNKLVEEIALEALDRIAEHEKEIRTNPKARVTDSLKKVFN